MPASSSASRSSTATWATKALVLATQISGPRLREQDGVGLAGDERPSGVGDREHPGPEAPRRLNGRQGIRSLPALAYGDDERAVVPDRVRVTVLAGDPDLDGYPGELLYGVLAEQTGVVGRATGDHHHPVYLREVEVHLREIDDTARVDAAEEGRAEGGRLLVDLLEHVVVVAAELYGLGVPVHLEATRARRARPKW